MTILPARTYTLLDFFTFDIISVPPDIEWKRSEKIELTAGSAEITILLSFEASYSTRVIPALPYMKSGESLRKKARRKQLLKEKKKIKNTINSSSTSVYKVTGVNYYYNNEGYEAFASLNTLSTYIKTYCVNNGELNTDIFTTLIPEYVIVFEKTLIDDEESEDLYIGTRQEITE
jgi:hypothetical protein